MTHFNHEWNGNALPEAIGDRYYAQDLNDDFNYLKHLPYEVFLQGRSRGVMIVPNDTWDNDTNSLALSGGFGVILQDNLCVDPDENFTIPPITKSSPRYERVPLVDTTLILPNDGAVHYIVATPTKRSLLQRIKTTLIETYASRIRYDGVITIQDTAPTTEQILIGLCHDKEYCLLIDNNPDQCKDNIILKKWFGQNKITHDFVSALQSYYNTTIASIETKISIDGVIPISLGLGGVDNGTFNNCDISINTISGGGGFSTAKGIHNGTFNNCDISINTISGGTRNIGIQGGTFNNCNISFGTSSGEYSIDGGTFNNCNISNNILNSGSIDGVFYNCNISIDTINGGVGLYGSVCNNCNISIDTINSGGRGVNGGTTNRAIFRNSYVYIGTVNSGGYGVTNTAYVILILTYIQCSATTDLSSTGGKLNVLNDTVLHAS